MESIDRFLKSNQNSTITQFGCCSGSCPQGFINGDNIHIIDDDGNQILMDKKGFIELVKSARDAGLIC